MRAVVRDKLHDVKIVLCEAVSSFQRNNGLSAASSLAFSATLALIPSLFLLTFLLSAVIGSSGRALAKTQELLTQFIPAYSHEILREVQSISSHMGAIGVLNGLVLLWSVTPLVADVRLSLGAIFRKRSSRPFLLEKLFDVAIGIVFFLGISAITVAGIIITFMERKNQFRVALGRFDSVLPLLFVTFVVFSLYFIFSKQARLLHLLIGASVTSLLWFAMRPAFHLFLLYNPGYGLAFGSFKSLFVVIIWIYFLFVVFLFGAELAACLGRDETVFIKKMMEGGQDVPLRLVEKYVCSRNQGEIIFNEGDPGSEMFSVLKGRVSIRKAEKEIGVIAKGKCFGGLSFLLSSPRAATAVALEDVELLAITRENINNLMNEYPEFVVELFREMAERLREANVLID